MLQAAGSYPRSTLLTPPASLIAAYHKWLLTLQPICEFQTGRGNSKVTPPTFPEAIPGIPTNLSLASLTAMEYGEFRLLAEHIDTLITQAFVTRFISQYSTQKQNHSIVE